MSNHPTNTFDPNERTSSTLLERARDEDRNAWEVLVKLYAPLVFSWCRKQDLQVHDAENVCQEVFASAYVGLHAFRKSKTSDSFRAWLRTIARNKFIDHIRREKKNNKEQVGIEARKIIEKTVDEKMAEYDEKERQQELYQLYRGALDLVRAYFSDQDVRVFTRVVIEGTPPAQVAGELGIPINIVYLAKSRILKRLRDDFGDLLKRDGQDM